MWVCGKDMKNNLYHKQFFRFNLGICCWSIGKVCNFVRDSIFYRRPMAQ